MYSHKRKAIDIYIYDNVYMRIYTHTYTIFEVCLCKFTNAYETRLFSARFASFQAWFQIVSTTVSLSSILIRKANVKITFTVNQFQPFVYIDGSRKPTKFTCCVRFQTKSRDEMCSKNYDQTFTLIVERLTYMLVVGFFDF